MEKSEIYKPEQLPAVIKNPRNKKYSISQVAFVSLLGILLGLIISAIAIDNSTNFVTEKELLNQTQLAFDYGVGYGQEYALAVITNQSVQCNQIPINYSGYAYTLYPLECLNLNDQEVK